MQGVVASGIAFAVQTWCIDRGGPVFVAVYQPVQTLVVAIMASIALGEQFYLGGYVFLSLPPPVLFTSLHVSVSASYPQTFPSSFTVLANLCIQDPAEFNHATYEIHLHG